MKLSLVPAVLLLAGLILSPRYLTCSDTPGKSDIVVIFPVPELGAVYREGRQLIKDGFADYLCVPTSLSLSRVSRDRSGFDSVRFPNVKPGADAGRPQPQGSISMPFFQAVRKEYRFPRYYENTHVEMLLAKRVMDAYGFRRALFVSSPYHMKRIKIMAAEVFGSAYDIRMVPSRFPSGVGATWGVGTSLPLLTTLQYVVEEFPKMAWFLCYDLAGRWLLRGPSA